MGRKQRVMKNNKDTQTVLTKQRFSQSGRTGSLKQKLCFMV